MTIRIANSSIHYKHFPEKLFQEHLVLYRHIGIDDIHNIVNRSLAPFLAVRLM